MRKGSGPMRQKSVLKIGQLFSMALARSSGGRTEKRAFRSMRSWSVKTGAEIITILRTTLGCWRAISAATTPPA